jgi:hypothetical protein
MLLRECLSSFAIVLGLMPSSFILRTSFGSMLGGRPLYFPAALAAATPSRCRSSMISRSNCATAARIVSCSRVVGLFPFPRVSNPMD